MTFYNDVRFPVDISCNSAGGPMYHTSVVSYRSGKVKRNIDWDYPLHKYDAVYGVRSQDDLEAVLELFHAMQGKGHGFRYKDWTDYKSCRTNITVVAIDQILGTGDGSTVEYQIYKYYTYSGQSKIRKITRPVSGTVLTALDAIATTNFTVNTTTGKITFTQHDWTVQDILTGLIDSILVTPDSWTICPQVGEKIKLVVNDGSSSARPWDPSVEGWYTVQACTQQSDGDLLIDVEEDIGDSTLPSDVSELSIIYGVPWPNAAITCGFEFDVPVYFDADELSINLDNYLAASTSVPIMEDRSQ